jgi:hypothetical protein
MVTCELALDRDEPTIPVTYVELSDAEERLVLASLDPLAATATAEQESHGSWPAVAERACTMSKMVWPHEPVNGRRAGRPAWARQWKRFLSRVGARVRHWTNEGQSGY